MAASKKKIREWIDRGIKTGATHVIVICDTWDYEDYPAYVKQNESVQMIVGRYGRSSMQRVMEIYNLSMDIEKQLNEYRAWNM